MKCDPLIETSLYRVETLLRGERVSLFDLATWKNGLAFRQINFSETGVPVIKIAELSNGLGTTTAYTQQKFSEDVHLTKGDLLFSWSGTPDTSIDIFRFQLEEGWLNQHIFKVTPKEEIVDRDYFYFLMKGLKPYFVRIASNKQTIGLGHVTIADLKGMSVVLPSLETQRKIASILSSLDDKIELNDRVNANLEEQAKAIFEEMFSDGAATKGILSDIAEVIMGQSPEGSSYNEDKNGTVFFQGRTDFGLRFPKTRIYTTAPKRMAKKNDVLLSVRAPVGDLNIAHEDCCIGRGLSAIRSKDNHQSFVYYTMLSLKPELNVFDGEGTVFGCANKASLNSLPISVPSKEKMDEFENAVAPIDAKILCNHDENLRLSSIRDTLLPRLLSGELDVSKLTL